MTHLTLPATEQTTIEYAPLPTWGECTAADLDRIFGTGWRAAIADLMRKTLAEHNAVERQENAA